MKMYEIKMQGGINGALYQGINKTGQKLECHFALEDKSYYMSFNIDGFWQGKIVGKDGVSSLLWAKKCLIDYILYVKKRGKCSVVVRASDKRRRAIYKRSLYPMGFKADKYGNFELKLRK